MNRAQRRMHARQGDRQRAQRRVSPAEAWMAQKVAIVKSDRSDLDDTSKREMLATVYACLSRLIDASMDAEDFMHVVEMNAVAGEIAYQLQTYDESGQIAAAGFKCLAAAEALQAVGTRRGRAGAFGVTGDELGAIREAVEYLHELHHLAPRGVVVAALDKIRRHMDLTLNASHGTPRIA